MAEYIEREAVYKKCGWYNTVNGKSIFAARKDEIAAISAADVVKVVRCKDCTYFGKSYVNGRGFRICPASGMDITESDFCSYGERKEK